MTGRGSPLDDVPAQERTVLRLALLLNAPQRSVLVLGPHGAGKTTLAQMIQTVSARPDSSRTAVYLHLGTWDPSEPFLKWAPRQVLQEAARRDEALLSSVSSIRHALASSSVTLVLDGLDQLPPEVTDVAVQRIASEVVSPWVMLAAMVETELPPSAVRLGCDIVTLKRLPVGFVAKALPSASRDGGWAEIASVIESEPDSEVVRTLTQPLFFSLADFLAESGEPPPQALVAGANSSDMRESLLQAEVAAVLAGDKWGTDGKPRSVWLRTIATIVQRSGNEDFVWWDLAGLAPWWVLSGLFVLLYFIFDVASVAVDAFGADSGVPVVGMMVTGLVALVVALKGDAIRAAGRLSSWAISLFAAGRVAAVTALLLVPTIRTIQDVIGILEVELINSVLVLLAFIIFPISSQPRLPISNRSPFRFQRRPVPRNSGWAFRRSAAWWGGLAAGAGMFALLVTLSRALEVTASPEVPAVALAVGESMVVYLALAFGTPPSKHSEHSSVRSMLRNLHFGACSALLWTVAVIGAEIGTLMVVFPMHSRLPDVPWWGWVIALFVGGLSVMIVTGSAGMALTLSVQAFVAILWLGIRGRLPFSLFEFLDEASCRGLLRKQGLAYSFRHGEVRMRLVGGDHASQVNTETGVAGRAAETA